MKRLEYISFLKIFSALAVVFLHTNGIFWTFGYGRYWITANIIESVFYFAVPIFFMVSGITLLDYRERYSTRNFLKKRFWTVFIPFLAWSSFSLVYSILIGRTTISSLSFINIIEGIFNTKYQTIYWFFIPLIAIYLSIPFISLIPKNVRKEAFKYIIIISVIFNSCLPLLCKLLNINYNSSLYIPVTGGYIIWVFIGYYLHTYNLDKNNRRIIYFLGLFGLLLHIFGTWYLSYQVGYIDETFKRYMNLPSILYSSAIFVFIKYNYDSFNLKYILSKFTKLFEKETFGVYLIHRYLIDFFVIVLNCNTYSIFYRIGGGILIFIFSALITKILHHIPLIKKIC